MDNRFRQDLQTMLDTSRNRIFERLLSKNDYITLSNQMREKIINQVYIWNQLNVQMIRHLATVADQSLKRAAVAETRIATLEQEVRQLRQSMDKAMTMVKTPVQQPQTTRSSEGQGWYTVPESAAA